MVELKGMYLAILLELCAELGPALKWLRDVLATAAFQRVLADQSGRDRGIHMPAKFRYDVVDQVNIKVRRELFPLMTSVRWTAHIKTSSEVDFHFVNGKYSRSVNLQNIRDSEMRLTNIAARWPRSTRDSLILR